MKYFLHSTGPFGAAPFVKMSINVVDFNLWGKQCIAVPKLQFFSVFELIVHQQSVDSQLIDHCPRSGPQSTLSISSSRTFKLLHRLNPLPGNCRGVAPAIWSPLAAPIKSLNIRPNKANFSPLKVDLIYNFSLSCAEIYLLYYKIK